MKHGLFVWCDDCFKELTKDLNFEIAEYTLGLVGEYGCDKCQKPFPTSFDYHITKLDLRKDYCKVLKKIT